MTKRLIVACWLLSALAMAQVVVGGKFTSGGNAKLQGRPHCSITTQSLPNGTVGTAYSQTVATLNCTAPLTFSVTSGALPTGLTLNASTGAITGTPNTNASYTFTIRVDDSNGRHATHSYTVVIGCTALAINTPSLPGGITGQVYSFQMQSVGGISPRAWTLSTGALPAGIALSSSGLLSGTPTTVQTTSGVIAVIDSCSPTQQIASNTFGLSIIGPLTITTSSLAQATEGVAYSAVFSAAGGTAPYTWSVTAGSLPAGLSLSSAGLLSGTATTAGTYSFTIQVQDTGAVNTTTAVFSITVVCVPLNITTASPLPNGVQGTPYSTQLNSTGGTGAVTWSIASGSLPTGVTLSSAGLISGTPVQNGTFTVSVTAKDSCLPTAQTVTASLTLTIISPVTITTNATLPGAIEGQPYTVQLAATGGTLPYSWSGTPPVGLTLGTNGVISGTPTSAGVFTFSPQAQDANGLTAFKTFTININCPSLALTSTSPMPPATVGVAYSFQFAGNGGIAPLTWGIPPSGPSMPPGLGLSSSGLVSGIPSTAGMFVPLVAVNDSCTPVSQQVSSPFSITVVSQLAITTASPLPPGTEGQAYSLQFAASGGTTPYTWSVIAGNLPTGLTLSANGAISGTPTATGTFTSMIRAQDVGAVHTASGSFVIIISCVPMSMTTGATLQSGTQGTAYSQQLQASGGNGSKTWSVIGGTLPAGVTLSSAGLLSGTPTVTGTFSPVIQVADSCSPTSQKVSATFTLVINAAVVPLTIVSTSPLPAGTESQTYSFQMQASGGTAPYTWVVTGGALPAGLSLSAGGAITGTPTATGTATATIRVTDNVSTTASGSFSITVSCVALTLSSTSPLPTATQGSTYSSQLQSSGGTGAKTWSVTAGSLPSGITLSSTGLLSGTPSVSGTFSATIRVSDSCAPTAQTASTVFSLTVNSSLTILTTSPLPNATEGQSYSTQLSATGGTSPYTWTVLSGSLPMGTALSASGLLSGTPPYLTPYSACTSTAVIQLPNTLPNFGLLTGANTLINDPEPNNGTSCFHSPIVRITDAQTDLSRVGQQYLVDGGGAPHNTWNTTSTKFALQAPGGGTYAYLFNPATMQATRMYVSQFPATGGWRFVASGGGAIWSYSNPDVFYTWPINGGGTIIQKYDTSSPTAPTPTTLFDFKNCTGVGASYVQTWTGAAGQSKYPPDRVFGIGLSNAGGQETGVNAAAYVSAPYGGLATGCYDLNTQTGVVSGPSGTIGTITVPDRFTLHAVGISKDGNWMALGFNTCLTTCSSAGAGGGYLWQIGTTNLQPNCLAGNSCSGHGTGGTTHAMNSPSPGVMTLRTYSNQASFASVRTPCPTQGIETHFTWPNVDTLDSLPILISNSDATTPFPTGCWNELDAQSPVDGTRWRFAHTYNAGDNQNFSAEFAIVGCSQDGNFCMWPSDMLHGLGSTANGTTCTIITPAVSGNCRTDVFIGKLPRAAAAASTGTYNPTIQATDSLGVKASKPFSLTLGCTALSITTASPLASGTQNAAYSQLLQSGGGTGTISWALTGGSLPTGVALSASGVISGTPSGTGTFTPTITASDQCSATAQTVSRAFSMTISPQIQPLVITTTTPLPAGTQGVNYSTTMAATGGVPPYTWTRTAGSLPAGLSLSTVGAITGTPTTIGTSTATIQVADNAAHTASGSFVITISCVALSIATTSPLPTGQINVAYSDQLQSSGGTGTKTWSLTAGAFPTGVGVSGAGLISGTPSAAGTFTPTVQVADGCSTPQTASRQYSLTIASSPLTITSTSPLPSGGLNTAYSFTLQAAGGTLPYTWSVTVGTLPTGLSLNASTGVISGTPTVAATTTFTIQVADSAAHTATKQFTVTFPVHTVLLSWTASTTTTPTVTYNVKRSLVSGGPYTPITVAGGISVLTYTDQTVQPATTYFYVVTALNSNGESGNSSEASAVIP